MADVAVVQDGLLSDPKDITTTWRERIKQAREDRQRFEPTWHSNLAFAAGKHHLVWDRFSRQLVMPPELLDRELYTADVITEQRAAALGELQSDSDRPELLLTQEGEGAEELQAQINHAVQHGWEYEVDADSALLEVRRLVLDLGTAAVRSRFDPTKGPVLQDAVPHRDGQPVLDPEEARSYVAEQQAAGASAGLKQIHQGRIVWEPLSAFNILTPPGVNHERRFPWEIVVTPVPLSSVTEEYGDVARGLSEDGDIGSVLGPGAREEQSARGWDSAGDSSGGPAKLRQHVWLYTCYERPCAQYPKGRVVVLAGNEMRLLKVLDELPYKTCDGEYRSGIAYFHWWRLNDRFWSRSFVEGLKDPQRLINRRRTQNAEIIDRGMPFVLVPQGSEAKERTGMPLEVIEIDYQAQSGQPIINPGIGPGEHMYRDVQELREDLSHASTLSALRLGENPDNVDTYSQLAL
jgi:hypothetical protein